MNTKKFIAIIAITAAIFTSCSKEKTVVTVQKNYEGQWSNKIPPATGNPLDFISMNLVLSAGGTGTIESKYISTGHVYPQSTLSWQKTAGDSVVITLKLPTYPSDTWELRGLMNEDNTAITTHCYYIPNNDMAAKGNYGTTILDRK
jgi:hypothetical protein